MLTGCAKHAADVNSTLKTGMSEEEVVAILGQPMYKIWIRFTGHTEDYLVYEYEFVPDIPV